MCKIILEPETHTYVNTETSEIYESVTTFIGKYKKPFDKDFYSKKVAKATGVTQEEILKKWEKITQVAQEKGIKIHLTMEAYLKNNILNKEYTDLIESFAKKTKFLIKNDSQIYSEKLLYSDDIKLAGTADLVIENGNTFYIQDFKTNKAFNFNSKYNDYFYEPIDHLQVCEFTTYSMQLSIYAYMYENLFKKKCGGLTIYYMRDFDGKRFWQEYNCLYAKDTVEKLFAHRKSSLLV